MSLYDKLANCHPSISRGKVWCRHCGKPKSVDPAFCFKHGWPKCCHGHTMTIDRPILHISYPHQWGSHFKDRKYWQGVFKGQSDVHDFNSKSALIEEAQKNDWGYEILKLNRKSGKLEVSFSSIACS